MARIKAAAIHLCLSLLVIGTIATTIFLLWYGRGLWHIAGLDRLFVVMLGIDIVAGPLLTLIVYDRRKPELRRDLSIVALLQLAFLSYGLHTAWASRPVFLVGAVGRLTLVSANEITDDALAEASAPAFRSRAWTGPRLVGAIPPKDAAERQTLLMSALQSGHDVEQYPRYYVPYAKAAPSLLANARRVDGLHLRDTAQQATLQSAIAATGKPATGLRALSIVSIHGDGTTLVDAKTGEPLRTLALDLDSAASIEDDQLGHKLSPR